MPGGGEIIAGAAVAAVVAEEMEERGAEEEGLFSTEEGGGGDGVEGGAEREAEEFGPQHRRFFSAGVRISMQGQKKTIAEPREAKARPGSGRTKLRQKCRDDS